jgi:hypothetical protein
MAIYRHRVFGPGSAGDVWVSTLHTQGAADYFDAHFAFGAFIQNAVNPNLKDMWAPTTKITGTVTDELDPITWQNLRQLTGNPAITGTSAGNAPSPRACLVIGLRTALPTRAGRGRMFFPSPSGDHYAATGKFVTADCAQIAADFAAALTTLKATITPVIAHRSSKTWTPITRVTIGDIPGTQRRRTNKDTNTYSASGV